MKESLNENMLSGNAMYDQEVIQNLVIEVKPKGRNRRKVTVPKDCPDNKVRRSERSIWKKLHFEDQLWNWVLSSFMYKLFNLVFVFPNKLPGVSFFLKF